MYKLRTLNRRAGVILVGAAVMAVAGTAAGLAAAQGGGIPGVNVPVPSDKSAAIQRFLSASTQDANTTSTPMPALHFDPIPAHVLGPNVPVPIPEATLHATSGWLVSDGKSLVAVYAGSAGPDRHEGLVVIVRQNLVIGKQTVRTVDAGRTGPLTIRSAPTGKAVETSAQIANIRLRAARAQVLSLHLSNDTVQRNAGKWSSTSRSMTHQR
jgi:hypothetical protein